MQICLQEDQVIIEPTIVTDSEQITIIIDGGQSKEGTGTAQVFKQAYKLAQYGGGHCELVE